MADKNFTPAFLRNAHRVRALAQSPYRSCGEQSPSACRHRPRRHPHHERRHTVASASCIARILPAPLCCLRKPRATLIHNQAVNIGANDQNYQVRDVGNCRPARGSHRQRSSIPAKSAPTRAITRVKFDKLYHLFSQVQTRIQFAKRESTNCFARFKPTRVCVEGFRRRSIRAACAVLKKTAQLPRHPPNPPPPVEVRFRPCHGTMKFTEPKPRSRARFVIELGKTRR